MRLAAVLLTLASVVPAASADPVPMATGAVPGPTGKTEIRIAREDLTIDVDRKAALVKAVLVLENGAAATKLDVGFPCERKVEPGIYALDCKTKIAVTVDGKKARVKATRNHWVWPMKLGPGQKAEVQVSYRSILRNDRYELPYSGMGALHYRLITGAAWAGPIGELHMKVTLPTDAIIHITPPGYTRDRGRIEWSLKDHEPTGDVAIFFHSRLLSTPDKTPEQRTAIAKDLREDMPELKRWAQLLHGVMSGSKLALPPLTEEEVAKEVEASAKLYEKP